jgi:hypothetical protein
MPASESPIGHWPLYIIPAGHGRTEGIVVAGPEEYERVTGVPFHAPAAPLPAPSPIEVGEARAPGTLRQWFDRCRSWCRRIPNALRAAE